MSKNFATNKLKLQKKQLSATITIALMVVLAVPMLVLPVFSQAWKPTARETFSFVGVSPNPVGKGQTASIHGWVYPPPSVSGNLYYNLTLNLTRPDGTKFTIIGDTYMAGTIDKTFVPDQAGNWSCVLTFPGDLTYLDRLPSVSAPYIFTVQEEPIPTAEYTALPTGAWDWPVSAANYEWFRISGGWYVNYADSGSSCCNWYSPGPEASHILWKKPIFPAGLLGGDFGHEGVLRPEQEYPVPSSIVAAQEKLYFRTFTVDTSIAGNNTLGVVSDDFDRAPIINCVDMYTGELLWQTKLPTVNYTTGRSVAAARNGGGTLQIVPHGETTSLWPTMPPASEISPSGNIALWVSGGGLWGLNPLNGHVEFYQLEPALSPTYDPFTKAWFIANYPQTGLFSCFSTKASPEYVASSGGATWPGSKALVSQTPAEVLQHALVWQANMTTTGIAMSAVVEGYIIRLQTNSTTGQSKLTTWDAKTGALVANGTYGGYWANDGSNPVYGCGVYSRLGADGRTYAWSFKTGSIAWVSDPMEYPWGSLGTYKGASGFGLIIAGSYDGYKYAYNATNGKLVWKYFAGTDNPYNYEYAGNHPVTWGEAISADPVRPKVYWASGEHTPPIPTTRGDMLYCNDLMTGELLWRLPYFRCTRSFWGSGVADGRLWYNNQYDGCLYMFGKGVTKTTVSTPSGVIEEGGSVLIQGRVTDLSPGTETLAERFPDGVPAVADDGMDDWMAYLYTIGTTGPLVNLDNVKGVNVTLIALGSDGSTVNIGQVTANRDGYFSYVWSPPSKDTFTVLASFEGSKSYYGSYGETAVGVTAAPPPSPTPTPPEAAPDTTPMFIASTAAIIIAIAIVGILLLRKRP